MTFDWPWAIVLTGMVPAFLWYYIRVERARSAALRRHAGVYSHASGLAARHPIVAHVPIMLFLASLAALAAALARPQAAMSMFAVKGTVVLALDVSASMKADDVHPTRLARAQSRAKEFVARYADDLKIGLVAFAGGAYTELEPVTDREALFAAIDRIALRPGTEIGSGIAAALAMIFPDSGIDARPSNAARDASRVGAPAARPQPAESTPGSYSAAAIVLISDGQSGSEPDPVEAARYAVELGVRIHTIGVGSAEGRTLRFEGWNMRVQLDEELLKAIAKITRGEYFDARETIDWTRIAAAVQPTAPHAETYNEITALFAAAAALAATVAALASLVRTQRVL